VSSQSITAISKVPASAKVSTQLPWIVAAALALGLLVTSALLIFQSKSRPARASVLRASINQPENGSFLPLSQFSVSPDGSRVVFVGRRAGGKQLLWARPLGAIAAQPLAGTDDATFPFWSPDSRFIGFFAQSKLKKVDASGGPPQTICD